MPIADRLNRHAPLLLGLLRIMAGVLFLSHGLVKLFGFPPGAQPGPQQFLTMFGVGGLIELVTGGLIALGLLTRPAAFLASGEMAIGYWMYHAPKGFYPAVNGGDAAILYCFLFLYLVAAGPGAFSLDGAMTRRKGAVSGLPTAP
ncbi:MAG: putative oxidoreductase [Sphingomonadales bacterium]|jgi:putative oxidoreductase|nr:putative oxidoreductase [Sphingomonadales bacterium]